jgi:hypothetical protein
VKNDDNLNHNTEAIAQMASRTMDGLVLYGRMLGMNDGEATAFSACVYVMIGMQLEKAAVRSGQADQFHATIAIIRAELERGAVPVAKGQA